MSESQQGRGFGRAHALAPTIAASAVRGLPSQCTKATGGDTQRQIALPIAVRAWMTPPRRRQRVIR